MAINKPSLLTELHAGPPPVNPPLFLAVVIVAIGIAAPWLFVRAGAPSPLLGAAALALVGAGIITVFATINAHNKRQADREIRLRACFSPSGVSLYRKPAPADAEFFPREQIKKIWLLKAALILDTTPDHPKPGRHRLVFSHLASPLDDINAAIAALNHPQDSAG